MLAAGNFQFLGRAQRDQSGNVSRLLPNERTVGDKRIFHMREAYVKFSIRFKAGRLEARTPMVPSLSVRRTFRFDDRRNARRCVDPDCALIPPVVRNFYFPHPAV